MLQSAAGESPCWAYIAAQGPLASTVDDFWKMVFENNCSVLIMLTRTVENNHIKCADYFNQRPGKHATLCGAGGRPGGTGLVSLALQTLGG